MSRWLADRASTLLADRTSRRGFLARSALVGSALAVAPGDYLLKPLTAHQAICGCANLNCDCGAACCNGFTQFCCTINNGLNICPPGTFLGGWWKADGSSYCDGPRYYMDCNAYCSCSSSSYESFCDPSCDGLTCECAGGSCDNMHIGCAQFRYGQCHQEVTLSGRILCRVVTCTPPWEIDTTCTTTLAEDDGTAEQNAPCLQSAPPAFSAMAITPTRGTGGSGTPGSTTTTSTTIGSTSTTQAGGRPTTTSTTAQARITTADGRPTTTSTTIGSTSTTPISGPPQGQKTSGYWLATLDGEVFVYGSAHFLGSCLQLDPTLPGGGTNAALLQAPIVAMAPTPTGNGYWLAAADGGIFTFGDASYYGAIADLNPTLPGGGTNAALLQAPIVAMAPTPTGNGYWLAAADGGIFTFGDAGYVGAIGDLNPALPPGSPNAAVLQGAIMSLRPTPTGNGYWLAAADGGVFTFGDAGYFGSGPGNPQ